MIEKTTVANTGLVKLAVQRSENIFVVIKSSFFVPIFFENRHFHISVKRILQPNMTAQKITLLLLGAFLFSCNQTQTPDKKISSNDTIHQLKTFADTASHLNQVEFKLSQEAWTDFDGFLGKNQIQMSLFLMANGELNGNYCIKEIESKIQLTGQKEGDKIILNALLDGKPNGRFEGRLFTDKLDRFEGTWIDNADANATEFKLTLQSIGGGTYDKRYADLYGTDEEVEKFMKQVKTSILNGDKEWMANHIAYPIKTTLYKNKAITIKNKKQFIENFELIFHQGFKDKIKSSCVCNMFANYQGVMLGNGEIWIYNKLNSTEDNYDFNIIAINN